MENTLIGCFYFKKTINGNLLGEYSNNCNDEIFAESAELKHNKKKSIEDYTGEYHSTWQQNGVSFFTNLKITYKDENTKKIFILEWNNKDNNFIGEGMLCDSILIGHYQNKT